MSFSKSLETDHKDLIHDIAFDFYGKRIATCSSDQNVKVSKNNMNASSPMVYDLPVFSDMGSKWKGRLDMFKHN